MDLNISPCRGGVHAGIPEEAASMRTGLLIDPIDPDLTYEDNLKRAADLGFQVVQLWYRDMVAETGGNPGEIVDLLAELGLELKSLAAYTDVLDPEREWNHILEELTGAMDFAAGAGVPFVVTESGGVPGQLHEWGKMIARFKELVACAAARDVIVLVENGPGVLVGGIDLMKRMMEELDSRHVGLNFDPANLVLVPEEVLLAVRELGPYIRDTHAKDGILLPPGSQREVPEEHIFSIPEGEEFIHIPEGMKWVLPPVGEGDVPFPEYLGALREVGFQGDLIIEFQGGGDREEAIVRSRRYIEGLLHER
jgi:sugar phosphate isomerase/epimerase